jgi:radical SAM protein with 4Fe4S-binding SPASM domain
MNKLTNQIINKIPTSYKRQLQRVMNAISNNLPKSLKPPFPTSILIDPANICNLKCPLCPTGLGKLKVRPLFMSFDVFKMVIQKFPTLKHICLFNWGEPFLNPSIFEMIRYAQKKTVRVNIHSNFSIKKDDDFFLNILKSNLDTLIISLDGASQQSYSKYRIGGDFNLVLSNIGKLTKIRDELHYKNPIIIWKYIVNRFNETEIALAKKMASSLGIEFEMSFLGLSDDLPNFAFNSTVEQRKEYWLPMNKKYQHPYYRDEYNIPLNNSYCNDLFKTIVINPDGKVFPCCWVTDIKQAFGDLTKESFEDIWYNTKYMYSRSLFSNEKYSGPKERTVCSTCNNFRKIGDVKKRY